MISNILLVVFTVAIFLNGYALFRHWQALRMFTIVMNNLIESQKQFNELMEADQQKTQRPPRPEPSVPFKKA